VAAVLILMMKVFEYHSWACNPSHMHDTACHSIMVRCTVWLAIELTVVSWCKQWLVDRNYTLLWVSFLGAAPSRLLDHLYKRSTSTPTCWCQDAISDCRLAVQVQQATCCLGTAGLLLVLQLQVCTVVATVAVVSGPGLPYEVQPWL
jgi:hypothetical protein